ncbi:MAG: endonuclease, partial [Lysobacteraceae bacterium]
AALMELENDGYGPQSSLAQFVDALNAGGGQWRFVDAGRGPGSDQIRVALVYRQDRVVPVGPPAVLEGGPFGERSRVPLAQAFRRGDGPVFVVVANHFKSKGCTGATGADADQGDGQACWNALRTESAARLDAWLQTDPTAQGSPLQLLVGDFNAYAMEDPLRLLRARGWQDAFDVAGVARPYSYLYAGMLGRLDHALLSPALAGRLRGAAEWHANADEPAGREPGDGAGPWRSSDHDPMLLGFDL